MQGPPQTAAGPRNSAASTAPSVLFMHAHTPTHQRTRVCAHTHTRTYTYAHAHSRACSHIDTATRVRRYGLRPLAESNLLDLVASVVHLTRTSQRVAWFAQFTGWHLMLAMRGLCSCGAPHLHPVHPEHHELCILASGTGDMPHPV